MIIKEFPILEFDENKDAFINPVLVRKVLIGIDKVPSMLIICFFKEVIDQLLLKKAIEPFLILKGENNSHYYKYVEDDILIIHGMIGGPACGAILEEAIALGVEKVMFCGGAGSLTKEGTCGKYVIVNSAIRDEGMSYHYKAPSREIRADQRIVDIIRKYFDENNYDYIVGKTWTTDAFYRETTDKIALRKQEGAMIVEMEQAGLLAISQFRNVAYGAIIYCGDDLSKAKWDGREWSSRTSIREELVQICCKLVKKI